jgi:phospholipid-binding lipoprotein MlaA
MSNYPNDPFEKYNRALYDVHRVVEQDIYLPIYGAYQYTLPIDLRIGLNNMADNVSEISNVFNDILQGELVFALSDASRFGINTTIGLMGFFDVARQFYLPKHKQSFSATLANWGTDPGPFIVIPGLGAAHFSEFLSIAVSYQSTSFLKPAQDVRKLWERVYAVNFVSSSGNVALLTRDSIDPYAMIRNLSSQQFNSYRNRPSYESLQLDLIDEIAMENGEI